MDMNMGEIAVRELNAFGQTVQGLDASGFATPTALSGWTVEDLVRHVAEVAVRQGEAFYRARLGIKEAPSDAPVPCPTEQLKDALAVATDYLTEGVRGLDTTNDRLVPLPFALLPSGIAEFILLVEYSVHRYDLEHGLGSPSSLAPDAVEAMTELLPLTLPGIAARNGAPPCKHLTIEPAGKPATFLSWSDGAWTPTDQPATDTWTLRGSPEAVARFVMGRGMPGDDLSAEPAEAGTQFKTLFPGP